MGKSTKKSSVTVDAAVVPAPEKPLKKGKRKAEDAIEKEVVKDKKQKAEVAVPKKVENSAKKVKAAKNGHVESESEESSGLDEAVVAPKKSVTPAKKETVAAAKSSSEDESSSDEDVAAAKNGTKAPAKKEDESSDDSSSEDDSPVAKKVPAKKDESSDDSESDDESSSDEDEAPKKVVPATKNGAQKKDESSSDESDSEDDSSSEDDIATKKVPAAAKKKDESSEESESDDESSDDEDPKATLQKVTAAPNKSKQDESDDDSEDESSEASEDEEPQKKNVKVPVSNKKSSSEESSEDEDDSSEEEEKPSKTPKKTDSDVKMTDVASATPKTPVTPKSQSNGSKTLFVGNLPFSVEQADVENFFKDVGEVVDVRFAVRKEDNSFKGFGHVEFATAEQAEKALKELNGQELLGRALRLDLALERGAYTPYSGGQDSQSFQKGGRSQGQSLFVRGFDKNASEDQIRSSLEQFFGSCGEVTRVSIPTQDGAVKGIAYVQFSDNNAINQALELNGSELEGSYLTVEQARPRDSDGSGRRDGGYGNNGGRRGGRFGGDSSGGRRGGRFGGDGSGGRRGGGRFGGNRGRGTPYSKPSMGAAATGKKTTFGDD